MEGQGASWQVTSKGTTLERGFEKCSPICLGETADLWTKVARNTCDALQYASICAVLVQLQQNALMRRVATFRRVVFEFARSKILLVSYLGERYSTVNST